MRKVFKTGKVDDANNVNNALQALLCCRRGWGCTALSVRYPGRDAALRSGPGSVLRDIRLFPAPPGLVGSGAGGTDPGTRTAHSSLQSLPKAQQPERWQSRCPERTAPVRQLGSLCPLSSLQVTHAAVFKLLLDTIFT